MAIGRFERAARVGLSTVLIMARPLGGWVVGGEDDPYDLADRLGRFYGRGSLPSGQLAGGAADISAFPGHLNPAQSDRHA
ncbi:MAG TPA: hypothetical protein VF714_06735, partial [Jatrophihabitans sp.]